MTRAERIAVARRKLPLDVLERRATIARRRRPGTMEDTDLALARSWRLSLSVWERSRTNPPNNYCSLCGRFGNGPWDDELKRYRDPISHAPNCSWGVEPPEPYPARSNG